ncbi:MAG: trypsin-like peptidase domain-containing protein [Clostridia bacterium]|nr:trypsin-like peptidase domain-containing protein [Clostridia bacterium]
MKKNVLISLLSVMLALTMVVGGLSLSAHSASAEEEEETRVVVTSPFTAAVAEVRSSVVGVNNYQQVRYYNNPYTFGWGFGYGRDRDYQESTQEVKAASGSGVVIAEGYVLTNQHVVDGASKLTIGVMQDGAKEPTEYDAVLVAQDENLDVAVIYCPTLNLKPVTLGDSDTLQVGDWAICIGNPLSDTFYGTVTAGIVSALDRSIAQTAYDKYGRRETITNTMIQVDAAINSGNSGGGMFSVTGELMGIPTLKYSGSAYSGASIDGINMCIPINAAKPLINDVISGVIKTPEIKETQQDSADKGLDMTGKPRLGVTIQSLNPNSYAIMTGLIPNGIYVSSVEENSPAQAAGIAAGDIIVEVDGQVVTSVSQVQSIIAQHDEGDSLTVKVWHAEGMAEAMEKGGDVPTEGAYEEHQVVLRVVDPV